MGRDSEIKGTNFLKREANTSESKMLSIGMSIHQ